MNTDEIIQISLSRLYAMDYQLKQLFAMHQHWKDGAVFPMHLPRKTSALLYFIDSKGLYTLPASFEDQSAIGAKSVPPSDILSGTKSAYPSDILSGATLPITKNSVVYLPQGSVYTTQFYCVSGQTAHAILLEFELLDESGLSFRLGKHPFVLSAQCDPVTADLFVQAADTYSAGIVSYADLRSCIYRILSRFSQEDRRKNIYSRQYRLIAEGILYMENDPLQALSIEEVAALCPVSPSCFRRLFKEYSGFSPIDYRIHAKIEQAKKLLLGNTLTVAETAARLGYDDPSYFCRIFKKVTGHTPGEYLLNN